MVSFLLLSLSLLQAGPPTTPTKQPIQFHPGDRAQVFAPTFTAGRYQAFTGRVKAIGPAGIVITSKAGIDTEIPLGAIVEWRRTERVGHPGLAAVLGATTGFMAGVSLEALFEQSRQACGYDNHTCPEALAAGAVVGILGGIAGYRYQVTRWLPIGPARPAPTPGTIVRISSPRLSAGTPLRGTVRSWRGDSVAFEPDQRGVVLTLAADEVSSVEWPVNRGRRTGIGAGIGALVGGVVGGVIGARDEGGCERSLLGNVCGLATVAGIGLGGVLGAVAGGVVGHFIRWTRWEQGEPGRSRITLAPLILPHGVGAIMSVAF